MDKHIGRAGFLLSALVLTGPHIGCARDGAPKLESFAETPVSRKPPPPESGPAFRPLSYGVPEVGDTAPPIEIGKWLNVDDATLGTGPDLEGKVIFLDFWGTWCPGCVQAMPQVQRLHDRYRDRGLVVVAVSYEDVTTLRKFLKENAYTMPVAVDTDLKCTMAYGIRSWPTSVLIDRGGKVAFVGHSNFIEPAIQKALRMRFHPDVMLMRYFDVANSKNERVVHDVLFPLAQRSQPVFNLRKWAVFAGGVAAGDSDEMVDGEKALREIVEARKHKNAEEESSILDSLATGGPESFDLKKWSRDAFGHTFPIRGDGVRGLLEDERYREVVEAFRERFPDREALRVAAGDAGLQEYCETKSPQCRTAARRALMVQNWVFKGRSAPDGGAFWRELHVTGTMFKDGTDRSKVENMIGVEIDGTWVKTRTSPELIQRKLELHVIMDALAEGHSPIIKQVGTKAESLRSAILAELEEKYGGQ